MKRGQLIDYFGGEIGTAPTVVASAGVVPAESGPGVNVGFCSAVDPANFNPLMTPSISARSVDDVETFELTPDLVPAAPWPLLIWDNGDAYSTTDTLNEIWQDQSRLEVVTAVRCSRDWLSNDDPVTGQQPNPNNWTGLTSIPQD